jgi:hypothetical protein
MQRLSSSATISTNAASAITSVHDAVRAIVGGELEELGRLVLVGVEDIDLWKRSDAGDVEEAGAYWYSWLVEEVGD